MEKDMEKEKNIFLVMRLQYYMKVNIEMEKEMEKEKDMIMVVKYYLKVNI